MGEMMLQKKKAPATGPPRVQSQHACLEARTHSSIRMRGSERGDRANDRFGSASIAAGYVQTRQNDPKRTLIVGARTTPAKEGNSENANRHCAPYCALLLSSFKRLIAPTAIETMPIAMQRPVPATIQPTPAPIIPREIMYASIMSLMALPQCRLAVSKNLRIEAGTSSYST